MMEVATFFLVRYAEAVPRLLNTSSVKSSRPSPYAALQYRDYRLFWFGQLISAAGTQMRGTPALVVRSA